MTSTPTWAEATYATGAGATRDEGPGLPEDAPPAPRLALSSHEIATLRMIAGEQTPEWGAAVSACLEFLRGHGLARCSTGAFAHRYELTPAGEAALRQATPAAHAREDG